MDCLYSLCMETQRGFAWEQKHGNKKCKPHGKQWPFGLRCEAQFCVKPGGRATVTSPRVSHHWLRTSLPPTAHFRTSPSCCQSLKRTYKARTEQQVTTSGYACRTGGVRRMTSWRGTISCIIFGYWGIPWKSQTFRYLGRDLNLGSTE
jgi:hypothetical protein